MPRNPRAAGREPARDQLEPPIPLGGDSTRVPQGGRGVPENEFPAPSWETAYLSRGRAEYERFMAVSPAMVHTCLATPELPTTYISSNVLRLLGYQPGQFTSSPSFWRDHVHPADLGHALEQLRQIRATGQAGLEYQFQKADGSWIWLQDERRLIGHGSGGGAEMTGYLIDVSEHKGTENALRLRESELRGANRRLEQALSELTQAQQRVLEQERWLAVRTLASGVAHDLNNALAPVRGYVELLQMLPEGAIISQEVRERLTIIRNGTMDAAAVIRRLRELYRADAVDPERLPIELAAVAERAIDLARPRWKDQALLQGRVIHVTLNPEGPAVARAVEEDLSEAVLNLVINAVDAILDDGSNTGPHHIELRTAQSGPHCILEVEDDGPGMSEAVHQRCLEPFYTTKGARGTGLGLAMVHRVVQQHQGRLTLRTAPGEGATWRLELPRSEQALMPRPAQPSAPAPVRILVVEDEPAVRLLLEELLQQDEHTVVTVPDGHQALEAVANAAYDLVLTDYAMPGMSGKELALALKSRWPELPVIMISGFGDLIAGTAGCPEAVDVLLPKPVGLTELRRAVTKALKAGD